MFDSTLTSSSTVGTLVGHLVGNLLAVSCVSFTYMLKQRGSGNLHVPSGLLEHAAGFVGDLLIRATRSLRIDLPTAKLLLDRVKPYI